MMGPEPVGKDSIFALESPAIQPHGIEFLKVLRMQGDDAILVRLRTDASDPLRPMPSDRADGSPFRRRVLFNSKHGAHITRLSGGRTAYLWSHHVTEPVRDLARELEPDLTLCE